MFRNVVISLLILLFASCKNTPSAVDLNQSTSTPEDKEAHEDSLALVAAYQAQKKIGHTVFATMETQSVQASAAEDAADDPAIWVNSEDPSASLIFGSNKRGGLAVYDLTGKEVEYYPIGNINNVDIIYDFPLADKTIIIIGCSNRTNQSIDLFQLNPKNGALTDISNGTLQVDSTRIDDIYGFTFGQDQQKNKSYAIINGKNGRMQQFELIPTPQDQLELKLLREVQFDSQTEGMATDDKRGFLYVGEENRGIWKLQLNPESGDMKEFLTASGDTNPNIAFDIEGITFIEHGEKDLLLASSQGNFSYAIFEGSGDNQYLTSFKIGSKFGIDGVEETDGLDVVTTYLNEDYPQGMLVVQDGFNHEGDSLVAQNFKMVSWKKVLIGLPKEVN